VLRPSRPGRTWVSGGLWLSNYILVIIIVAMPFAQVLITVLCGKSRRDGTVCSNTLARWYRADDGRVAPLAQAVIVGRDVKSGTPMPKGARWLGQANSGDWRTTRYEFPCARRCGARYVFTEQRMLVLYLDAIRRGLGEIFLAG
jgi:hypothetical protein